MLGLDFGTTNSAVAWVGPDGEGHLATFPTADGTTATFRSALHFPAVEKRPLQRPEPSCGPSAIESYLDEGGGGRFLQSIKSSLGSGLFDETYVSGWKFTLEDLVSILLSELRRSALEQFPDDGCAVVLGRPVHFATGPEREVDLEGDQRAMARLTEAARAAGFEQIEFAYEPVAAASAYERSLEQDELVLIGDFGGGTSDFCLIELGPRARTASDRMETIRGVDGVPIAGDVFDGRIVRSVVSPRLGLGSERRSEHGKVLPIPRWIYSRLERWEDVSFLSSPQMLEKLRQLAYQADEPNRIESLIQLVEDDLGYLLYREVERTKRALSDDVETRFRFDELARRMTQRVRREDFEQWVMPELERLSACVDRLLEVASVGRHEVDRVFLTGGSSLVPCVRQLFIDRFGADRLRGGEELTTVARGLALLAADRAA